MGYLDDLREKEEQLLEQEREVKKIDEEIIQLRKEYGAQYRAEALQTYDLLSSQTTDISSWEDVLDLVIKYLSGNIPIEELKSACVFACKQTTRERFASTYFRYWQLGCDKLCVIDSLNSVIRDPENLELNNEATIAVIAFYQNEGGTV